MSKVLFGIFGFFFFGFYVINAREDSKLLFVQILFRHGDRTPIKLYPNDPNPESFWDEGLGQLTNLGKKQHFALGKFLKKMYGGFSTANPNEVRVTSTDYDRTLMSAEANLASFFAPGHSNWRFDKQIDWQPIRISYTPKEHDMILGMENDCPRALMEMKKVQESFGSRELLSEHEEMFRNLTEESGLSVTNWHSAFELYDTLSIERKYRRHIPPWAEHYWNELKEVSDQSLYWAFNSPVLHRLLAGPLLKNMIDLMDSKIAGEIPSQKFQIYSAHDSNIAVLLEALKLYDMKSTPPQYCATLLLELHELADGEKAVRLLFLNPPNPESEIRLPRVLTLSVCSEFCPLNHFKEFTEELIPDDWEKECRLENPSEDPSKGTHPKGPSKSAHPKGCSEGSKTWILGKKQMPTELLESLLEFFFKK